ncbi:ankyrin repeat domain-containing protein [Stieleria varia]|uniref:Ankyrin repeats (3 copies) n=1 Tax=Stieleria varia TaxID=2528005 RepID=A0A5C6AHR3_9BACT|nr:ankyrin repeat domain-containing protein [Stieleria varia]TWT98571.1 Ankyrin repeats (3 copies) [Stieleria varia]
MSKDPETSERLLALIAAAKDGNEDFVFQWLLDCCDEIDARDNTHDEYSALHCAANKGHVGVMQMLLVAGADVNNRSGKRVDDEGEIVFQPGHTALMLAARYNHLLAVAILLSAGADPQIRGEQDWTALHSAAVGGNVTIVEKLLSLNVDHSVASSGRHFDEELGWYFFNTPMHVAASNGNAEIVSCLLEHGASPHECWVDSRTPIFYAAAYGHHDVIHVLCNHGVDSNSRESRHPGGYFIDYTPLHYAARNGHVEAVKALLACGAEPRIVESHMKETALDVAESNGHEEVAFVLRSHRKR